MSVLSIVDSYCCRCCYDNCFRIYVLFSGSCCIVILHHTHLPKLHSIFVYLSQFLTRAVHYLKVDQNCLSLRLFISRSLD